MNTAKDFHPQIPKLNLPEGADMLLDFTTEALSFLMSTENILIALEAVPENKESKDSLFKVFHTISGLAQFLELGDIQILACHAEHLSDKVRKDKIPFTPNISSALSFAVDGLRKLLMLLNEQILNNGQLTSPYFDITEILTAIKTAETGKSLDAQRQTQKTSSQAKEIEFAHYDKIREVLKQKSKTVTIDRKTIELLMDDVNEIKEKLKITKDSAIRKQKELVNERDFAIKLSQQSQEMARMKSNFLASMTHEIRTLITSVLGFSDLLLKTEIDNKQREQINAIHLSANLLLGIVNNILDFSKIERGKLTLEHVPFRLDETVNDIFTILSSRVEGKPVQLSKDVDLNVPLALIGDPTRLKQIIINLMDNAIKFTKEGEVALSITRLSDSSHEHKTPDDCFLRFEIRDTGVGIPQDKKELIFESFTQAEVSTTRQFGGTGLGLSICRSYVELMGGKIWVESTLGKGSKFIFTIGATIDQNAQEQTPPVVPSSKAALTAQEEAQAALFNGARILVAEDSLPNQGLLEAYFDDFGCQGDFASNGREAVEKIKNNTYDLCLMDLQMPVMDGVTATKLIRTTLQKDLPIIALTAAAMEEEIQQCKEAGITDFINKPFMVEELKQKILEYLRKGKRS